jgi:hypothetical protein
MKTRSHTLTPLALATALLMAPATQAATRNWACSTSYWDYAECWSPTGVPLAGDDVVVAVVGGVNTTVWFDEFTGNQVVRYLTVNAPSGPSATLSMAGGSLSTASTTVGLMGYGSFVQSGGTHAVSGSLYLGEFDVSATGSYQLQGGMLDTKISYLGVAGYGQFDQTGGVHRTTSLQLKGRYSFYHLYGGSLQVSGATSVEGGAILRQTTGSFTTNVMFVGRNAGDGGYDMGVGNGQLSADTIGVGWDGWMNQGDSATVTTAALIVGGETSQGLYRLQGGSLQVGLGLVGDDGRGTFVHSAGTHRVSDLVLGYYGGSQGTYTMEGGTLESTRAEIGRGGSGEFNQTGGTHRASESLVIGSTWHYRLGGWGTLQVTGAAGAVNHGTFEQTGGTFAGTLHNHGSFVYGAVGGVAGTFSGHLVNHDSIVLNADATFADGLRNETSLDLLPTGRTLTLNGQGLTNNGSFVLAGGKLQGNGTIVNLADMGGHGRITGWEIDNFGTVSQRGGTLALAPSSGAVFNYGRWDLQAGQELKLDGNTVVFDNLGSVALAGGRVGGSGQLLNRGVVSGSGNINSRFHNSGTLAIAAGEQVTVMGGFTNDGQIDLRSGSAALSAGPLVNQGLLLGQGRVMAPINNHAAGRIVAQGGLLTLGDTVANAGLLGAEAGSTLLLQRALLSQTGTLQLSGGSIDTNGQHLRNDGTVTGWGTLRATTLDNAGRLLFGAGNAQVFGSVNHLEGAQIVVSGTGTAHFHGTVQACAGSEIRVSADSAAVYFAAVSQANGVAFTGSGAHYFEGGLSVGDSPGAGGAEGDVVFGQGNLYRAELGGLSAGSGFDQFLVGGALGFGGRLQLSWWGGFEGQAGQQFDLFDWGSASGRFTAIDFSAAPLADGLRWDTSRLYSTGEIGVSAVPEPGSWALMAGGLAVLLARRRRSLRAMEDPV